MMHEKRPRTSSGRAEHILLLLEESGDWYSGEKLSRHLGISRAAVAKQIAGLRLQGHVIQSVTGKGHKLLLRNDVLNAADVAGNLRTRRIGRAEWHFHSEVSSTSDEAIKLALSGAREGSVVVAEQQSQGRGRRGHAWFSAPHGLMFSVLLRPAMPEVEPAWLTSIGVLAVAEAIQAITGLRPVVKAPNDVYLGKRKVAGILAETGFRSGEPEWAVLGIGCNVNTLPEEFSPLLRNSATSLFVESGKTISRASLLAAILNEMEFWYEKLESADSAALKKRWQDCAAS